MVKKGIALASTVAAGLAGVTGTVEARDQIRIVGSSTVYPFATVVAKQFGNAAQFKAPVIESTGSGGGLKLFCAGVGVEHPDITNASRAINQSEVENCAKDGVTEVTEVKVSYDGIARANSKKSPQMSISRQQLFLAVAGKVPSPDGSPTLVDNTYVQWSDIDRSLPDVKIEVLGPPQTSGTRDAFADLAIEGGESDNLIVQKLEANPNAFGFFGHSFLEQNADKVQGSTIDGGEPNFETIANGNYAVSRPLFFYVKEAHVGTIPHITSAYWL